MYNNNEISKSLYFEASFKKKTKYNAQLIKFGSLFDFFSLNVNENKTLSNFVISFIFFLDTIMHQIGMA